MTILSRILETKRAEVAARRATMSMTDLTERIRHQPPARGFHATLAARASAASVPSCASASA